MFRAALREQFRRSDQPLRSAIDIVEDHRAAFGFGQIVHADHDIAAFRCVVGQHAPDAIARHNVEARGRLVEQQQRRRGQHRRGELRASCPAARKPLEPGIGESAQPPPIEHIVDPASGVV